MFWAQVVSISCLVISAGLFSPICVNAADTEIVKAIEIRYVGVKSVSKQRVLAKLSTRIDEPLSDYRVDQDMKALLASGEGGSRHWILRAETFSN